MTAPAHAPPLAAAVVMAVVVVTGCGARLPSDIRTHAADEALSQRLGTLPGAAPTTGAVEPSAPDGAGASPTAAPGSTAVPTRVAANPSAGPSSRATQLGTGPRPASSAPPCGSGTDVGLTSSTITLGAVATLTGPVAGLFQGAIQGIESFASYVNATAGGICGHQVHVVTADDGTNCTQNENATQNLLGRSFALVGSFSLYDGCGATVLSQHPTVPDIHVALDPAAEKPSNHFDLSAGEAGYATGMFHYYAQKYGAAVRRVGTIVENIPSAVANQKNMVNAAESQGWHFVDSILESPTNGNFQGDFVKMCQQEHIKVLFELTETAQNAATMVRNEGQAGCPKSLINIIPISYDQAFVPAYGGNPADLNGIQGWSEYALFYNKNEAANIPALSQLQTWFARDYPGQPLNLYAMFAWVDGLLFQQAVEHAGQVINRQTVLRSLRRITNFDGGGIVSPRDPGVRPGVHCYILWQLENGQFQRIDDPKAAFRCDGRFLARPGG